MGLKSYRADYKRLVEDSYRRGIISDAVYAMMTDIEDLECNYIQSFNVGADFAFNLKRANKLEMERLSIKKAAYSKNEGEKYGAEDFQRAFFNSCEVNVLRQRYGVDMDYVWRDIARYLFAN